MRKVLVVASLAVITAFSVPARAAVNTIVAPPAGFLAGYATTQITVIKGQPVTFVNTDVDTHDVVSLDRANNQPLFESDLIGAGTTEVKGINRLVVGKTYRFVCSRHGAMEGTLTVQQ